MFLTLMALLTSLTLNIIIILLIISTVLVGGILPLIERKFLSLIQRRVGPNIVGHKGRFQFIADALKLFLKEIIFIKNINVTKGVLLPLIYFFLNLCILFILVWDKQTTTFVDLEYTIPYLLIIFNMCNLVVIQVGLVLKNKYTQISSARAANTAISFDLIITLLLIYLVAIGNHFNFFTTVKLQGDYFGALLLLPSVFLFLLMYLVDVGRAPFDLVEAESELIMGFHSEYSSFLFALFILGEYIHIYIFSYLMASLFIYI